MSTGSICLDIYPVGNDVLAVIQGGDKPHIGCAVLSVPRKSLSGDGTVSCTSSVINITGHKDEQICRFISESIAAELKVNVVCSGGFHIDNISEEGIREVIGAVRDITGEISIK
ncbi:MAG: hypothetical protein IJH95_05075 [Mogibacterium sp.]|nr:hypothetical protein [Mogibacterium sp.]